MSQRRRSRYTVTYTDGTKEVVMDYQATSIPVWLEPRVGKTVAKVVKGDYRKVEAKREAFREGGFTIDKFALQAAKREFGLKWPVKIVKSNHFAFTAGENGHHKLKGGSQLYHLISIKSYLTPEQASLTLWHELTHALQAERDGGSLIGWRDHSRQQRIYSYSNRPIEREANRMARTKKDSPLCY